MSTPGSCTVIPGKRFYDDTETLDPADLNALARPLIFINYQSIGADQLVTADVVEIILGQSLGTRASYLFAADKVVQAGFVLPMGSVAVPGVKVNDQILPLQVAALTLVTFWALVTAPNVVTVYARVAGGTNQTVPAGTVVQLVVFSMA